MNFADGVLAGEMRSYDAAGALAAVSHFTRGQLDGETVDYWENGKIRQRSRYKDDVQDGPTTTYLITGELEQQVIYENGKPVAARPAAHPQSTQPRPASWLDRLISGP